MIYKKKFALVNTVTELNQNKKQAKSHTKVQINKDIRRLPKWEVIKTQKQ